LTGMMDYAKTNAITGNLKLAATALDITPYYDLFAGTNNTRESTTSTEPEKTPAPSATKPAPVVEAREPDAMELPVRDFTFAVAIDHCYLRKVDLMNLQTTTKLDGGHIVVNPCQFVLNGGSINASVDMELAVPGYKYDVVFNADRIPLAPLADSFSPTYRDSAQGVLTAHIQVQAAGITGRSLRKTLTGKTTLILTNANIQIVGAKVKAVLTPISRLLGAPELLTSPLDYVDADLRFGEGQIETRKFTAYSAAVLAESSGMIPIADVLADSPLSQPIDLSLSRQLAKRLHPNTPSVEGYMKLPRLVHLAGTLGDPTAKTTVSDTAETVVDTLGKTAGTVKQGVGRLLFGQNPGTTNTSSSTNSSFNPLNLFRHSKD
jgi:AsmA-like protein